jgi:uncharacterized tellurite resistance protein B-like protein
MRSYPRNSPQAAARIVALALLADGNLCRSELEALERHGARAQLGLSPAELHTVVHDLCQDLLAASDLSWGGSSQVDPRTLAGLMAEVQDPDLQLKVLKLCVAVVETDDHVAEGESAVLAAALTQWGLPQVRTDVKQPQPALQDA